MHLESSLTIIDLDGLKFYNDTYGHDAGDKLLCCFGDTLQKQLGDGQKLYRLGGDEFTVLCQQGDIGSVDKSIEIAVEEMSTQHGFSFAGASFGSALLKETGDISELMGLADSRMYEKKRAKKGR